MSGVHEIQAAIQKLSPRELEGLREWFEEFFEDQLELTDEIKAILEESHVEIAFGHCRTRQP